MRRRRDLNQLVVAHHGRTPGLRLHPVTRPQNAQDRDFVAGLEFGTPNAVLPGLQRQGTAFDLVKPTLLKNSTT